MKTPPESLLDLLQGDEKEQQIGFLAGWHDSLKSVIYSLRLRPESFSPDVKSFVHLALAAYKDDLRDVRYRLSEACEAAGYEVPAGYRIGDDLP